jgi:Late exocytosis, associated with Golgi transport
MNSFVEDEILESCGMDSLCFLRLLNMGYKISLCAILNAIWLIPTYKYSESSDETAGITDPIVQITVSNVPSGSRRLIATVVAAYIFFGYIMHLILDVSISCISGLYENKEKR